jgi:hypothetical protein
MALQDPREDLGVQAVVSLVNDRLPPEAFGALVRRVFDRSVQSARTNRVSVEQLEKSAKTAIGTEVEIDVREALGVPKGKLDLVVDGHDADVKWSLGSAAKGCGTSWMIPREALGEVCLLVSGWDTHEGSFFTVGVFRASQTGEGLNAKNQDGKRSIARATLTSYVWWLHNAVPMESNFLLRLPEESRSAVLAAAPGEARLLEALRAAGDEGIAMSVLRELDVPEPQHRFNKLAESLMADGRRLVARNGAWFVEGRFT